MSDRELVQTMIQVRHFDTRELAASLRIPKTVWENFLKGDELPEQFRASVHDWVEQQPPWTEEEAAVIQGNDQVTDEVSAGMQGRQLPASVEAMAFIQQVCGDIPESELSVDRFLEAFGHMAVLGRPDTLQHLEAQCPNMAGERLSLEDISQRFLDLQEGHERQMHRMTQRGVVKETVSHSIEDCANGILSCCPPQVIEQMEMASHARDEPPWKIIAGMLVMWRRDFLGADTTEVGLPGSSTIAVGQQLWSRQQAQQRQGPSIISQPICETCGHAFAPGPNQHRPRFGCRACGEVWNIKVKNESERKRAADSAEYHPNVRPETLDFVLYQLQGYGPCTCGASAANVA